jgi:hypothetical protein
MGRPPLRPSSKIPTKFICSNLVEQFRTLVKNRELPIPHTLNQGKQFFQLSQFDFSEFPINCIRSIFYCPQRKQIRVIFNNYCTETNRGGCPGPVPSGQGAPPDEGCRRAWLGQVRGDDLG